MLHSYDIFIVSVQMVYNYILACAYFNCLPFFHCRYQGIDWRDSKYWECNGDESPYKELHNDGVSLDPLEVVFVKVRDGWFQRWGFYIITLWNRDWLQN